MTTAPLDRLLETFDTEAEAIERMHKYAQMLRRKKLTQRYGVYVERTMYGRRTSPWGVYIIDRMVDA